MGSIEGTIGKEGHKFIMAISACLYAPPMILQSIYVIY